MFKACYLHCGHAKTGSTSVQTTLSANAALAEQVGGVYYPASASPSKGNHADLIVYPYASEAVGALQSIDYDAPLAKLAASYEGSAENLVLSSEGVANLRKEEELEKLRDDILAISEKLVLLYYVRHPLSFAPSFAQTSIKNGLKSLSFFVEHPYFVRYAHTLGKFIRVFGRENIVVRDFSKSKLVGQDAVADFVYQVTGSLALWVHPDFRNVAANESLSLPATVLADYIYRQWPQLRRSSRLVKQFVAEIKGPRFCLPNQCREMIEAEMPKHLRFLKDEFSLELELAPGAKLQFDDVDYAAILTPELKESAQEFAVGMGAEASQVPG